MSRKQSVVPHKPAEPAEPAEHRWRIFRIKSTPAASLGPVTAPDEKTALEKAATEFKVRPEFMYRLMARRV
jgi:hypothetical protein